MTDPSPTLVDDDDAVATERQAWDRCTDQEIRTDGGTIADLPASHRDVLATIAALHDDHPPTASAIAASAPVAEPHIYHILQELDGQGYIDRHPDSDDGRIKRSTLTPQGIAVLRELKAQYAAVELPAEPLPSSGDSDSQLRTDGGTPMGIATDTDATATLGLSMFVETPTTTVDTDGEATIRVRPDHGDVRIEAAEDGDRTAEAVLAGSPVAMATLADELYAAAATAANDTDAVDPLDGDANG